jgi:hypothetical protein
MGSLPALAFEEDNMKVHGWCVKCHKIKRVNVKVPMPGTHQQGVCDDCAEKERTARLWRQDAKP